MHGAVKYFIFLTLATICLANTPRNFRGHKVFRLRPTTDEQIQELLTLQDTNIDLEFWTAVGKGFPVDIMVPPHLHYNFQNFISSSNFESNIMIEDVQEAMATAGGKHKKIDNPADFNWNDYNTLDEINEWLMYLVEHYQPFVKLIKAGRSYENRTIYGVHVSFGQERPAIFIEGGIHANEWISPATVTFILNQILTSKDLAIRAAVESRDWYIVPVLNPDGYVYTHTKDRTWRKNRRPNNGPCVGADLNRNFPYKWMEGGADLNPCFPHYAGNKALSEVESRTFANYFNKIAPKVEAYLSFHSYLQVFLIPFADDSFAVPANNDELHRMGNVASRALYGAHGTRFLVGNGARTLYVGSGTSTDWIMGNHTVRAVYVFELRDNGFYGHLLPPDQIIPTGEESLAAVVSFVTQFENEF